MFLEPSVTIAVGLVISMICHRRTGLGSGGLISPGIVALSLGDGLTVLYCLVAALGVAFLLRLAVVYGGFYGRQRVGLSMVLSLALRGLVLFALPGISWVGWVVPGLIAADMERQGVVETLAMLIIASLATVWTSQLLSLLLTWTGVV